MNRKAIFSAALELLGRGSDIIDDGQHLVRGNTDTVSVGCVIRRRGSREIVFVEVNVNTLFAIIEE